MRLCAPSTHLLLAADADAMGAVSMSRCSRLAATSCRAAAAAALPPACAAAAQGGVGGCAAERFRALLNDRAAVQCKEYAMMVTEVNPDTSVWVPSNPQLRAAADADVAGAGADATPGAAHVADSTGAGAAASAEAPETPDSEATGKPEAPTNTAAQPASGATAASTAPGGTGSDAKDTNSLAAPANGVPTRVGGRRWLRLS